MSTVVLSSVENKPLALAPSMSNMYVTPWADGGAYHTGYEHSFKKKTYKTFVYCSYASFSFMCRIVSHCVALSHCCCLSAHHCCCLSLLLSLTVPLLLSRTVTVSHRRTVAVSHCYCLSPSHCYCLSPSHCYCLSPSHCYCLSLLLSLTVPLLLSLTVTVSHCCFVLSASLLLCVKRITVAVPQCITVTGSCADLRAVARRVFSVVCHRTKRLADSL